MFRRFGDGHNALRRFGVGGRGEITLANRLESNAAVRDNRPERRTSGAFDKLRGNKNTSNREARPDQLLDGSGALDDEKRPPLAPFAALKIAREGEQAHRKTVSGKAAVGTGAIGNRICL